MSWLDKLESHGKTQVREARKRRLRPLVQSVYVTTRHPKGNDPGAVAEGHFIVEDGRLTLTDENGTPLDKPVVIGSNDPRSLASSLIKARLGLNRGELTGFNRPL